MERLIECGLGERERVHHHGDRPVGLRIGHGHRDLVSHGVCQHLVDGLGKREVGSGGIDGDVDIRDIRVWGDVVGVRWNDERCGDVHRLCWYGVRVRGGHRCAVINVGGNLPCDGDDGG